MVTGGDKKLKQLLQESNFESEFVFSAWGPKISSGYSK